MQTLQIQPQLQQLLVAATRSVTWLANHKIGAKNVPRAQPQTPPITDIVQPKASWRQRLNGQAQWQQAVDQPEWG